MFDFKSSLKQGHAGEARFAKLYPAYIRTDGRREDFIAPTGELVELKCESRTIEQTANLALELSSSEGRPGAIERAITDGITYIVYMFADGLTFTYNPKELFEHMSANGHKYRLINIPNRGYTSVVMLVPRADVAHLLQRLP
jgi:hypothetical protein